MINLTAYWNELGDGTQALMFEAASNTVFKGLIQRAITDAHLYLTQMEQDVDPHKFAREYALLQLELNIYTEMLNFLNEAQRQQLEAYAQERPNV